MSQLDEFDGDYESEECLSQSAYGNMTDATGVSQQSLTWFNLSKTSIYNC